MANLTETSAWEAGVYQIEQTDPVVGGPPNLVQGEGISNVPTQQLANRTAYLKAQIEAGLAAAALLTKIKAVDGAGSGLDADLLDGKHLSQIMTDVQALLDNLVAAAPGTLDTLNELAAALGDDPDFAATMTAQLALKLNAASYSAADVLAKIKAVDGAGSGLDADLFDGLESTKFLRSDIDQIRADSLTVLGIQPAVVLREADTNSMARLIVAGGNMYVQAGALGAGETAFGGNLYLTGYASSDIGNVLVRKNGVLNVVWHAGNDGAGSGLDADLLDGKHLNQIMTDVQVLLDNLVAAAPGTLDTLNELAAALGDDPDFAATMTAQLALKLNAASYSAADVLAKIKAVDGAGSGLDADLLDGKHLSEVIADVPRIGVSQTYKSTLDGTITRAAGTAYLNSTTKPIVLSITPYYQGTATVKIETSSDGATWRTAATDTLLAADNVGTVLTAVVPAGFYYRFTNTYATTIRNWSELS